MSRVRSIYRNAEDAFENLYNRILENGILFQGCKTLFNCGFYLEFPLEVTIETPWRKWSPKYAKREWNWYLSGNPNAEEISKHAPIWKNMMDSKGNVNSNYGYQWNRESQLHKTIQLLKDEPNTRRAAVSIYDGKEIKKYKKDTPCTYAIDFTVIDGTLCMTVMMRSNDLWYGFCNDQYCFASLQSYVANELKLPVGWYYHFAVNMHIYERHFKSKEEWERNSQ